MSQTEAILLELQEARKRLVDTSARNRLIHVNRENKKGKFINIVNKRSDDVFRILNTPNKKMGFYPLLKTDKNKDAQGDNMPLEGIKLIGEDTRKIRASNQLEVMEVNLTPDALQKRLLQWAREAKTAEEELGINVLYLALGFLIWRESDISQIERAAPLVLLPVELMRAKNASTYQVVIRNDDITTNISLKERLMADFGIQLPEIDMDENEGGWSPSAYFAKVKEAIAAKQEWKIEPDSMQLGSFFFVNRLVEDDINPEKWQDDGLINSDLIARLLSGGFESTAPLFGENGNLDEKLQPADIVHVVDADSSQTKVIEEVRKGRNLVVQGPPGTGKSQTITNIIAAAVHDGKKVLFMAEKEAALSVVHKNMKEANLENLCLELHSRKANKRAVKEELGRTLRDIQSVPQHTDSPPHELKNVRDELNKWTNRLHENVVGRDYSPHSILSALVNMIGRKVSPPHLNADGLDSLTNEKCEEIKNYLTEWCDLLKKFTEIENGHPYKGVGNIQLTPVDVVQVAEKLQNALRKLEQLQTTTQNICGELEISSPPKTLGETKQFIILLGLLGERPPKIDAEIIGKLMAKDHAERLERALRAGAEWREEKNAAQPHFHNSAWESSIKHHHAALQRGVTSSIYRLLGFKYHKARSALAGILSVPLPKQATERLKLLNQLIDVQNKREALKNDESWLATILGDDWWRGELTDYVALDSIAAWLKKVTDTGLVANPNDVSKIINAGIANPCQAAEELSETTGKFKNLAEEILAILDYKLEDVNLTSLLNTAPLYELKQRLYGMANNTGRYGEWQRSKTLEEKLKEIAALGQLIGQINAGEKAPADALDEFNYAYAEARWNYVKQIEEFNNLHMLDRKTLVKKFQENELARLKDVKEMIRSKHADSVKSMPQSEQVEMQVIRNEIARNTRLMPVRKLIGKTHNTIKRIKPAFLMRPVSIAQFLPKEKNMFDLLVIDEASQVRPEYAFGAIARSKQIVVVGDQKQLPPTPFFERYGTDDGLNEDDEEEEHGAYATDMESILSLAEARGLRSQMLQWHYRSQDPSLIRVSNKEFYENNLVLLPSPREFDNNYGLSLVVLEGVYYPQGGGEGRAGTNPIEAQKIAEAIAEHARENKDKTLGIAAFSKTQIDAITEAVDNARRKDNVLDEFLHKEDVFFKNIENVQGDERDVIFISVGYGPSEPGGRLQSMNFGPVNNRGGERRLNVLFTRARERCRVFASFNPDNINVEGATNDGRRILKEFLQYARNGKIPPAINPSGIPESEFEEDVAREIRNAGFIADYQVGGGVGKYRIDLGARHQSNPGKYILAVECDGATYHSSLFARERDRLRQEALEKLGWKFHRIWSTDWFYRRTEEISRLQEKLENARQGAGL